MILNWHASAIHDLYTETSAIISNTQRHQPDPAYHLAAISRSHNYATLMSATNSSNIYIASSIYISAADASYSSGIDYLLSTIESTQWQRLN
jgi:hypothetical protein